MEQKKICNKCHEEKDIDRFEKFKRGEKEYIRNVCKTCKNKQRGKQYPINRIKEKSFKLDGDTKPEYKIENRNDFSSSDIKILKNLISEYKNTLNKNIEIDKGERERKTYNIEKILSKKILNEARKQGVTASDILNIVLKKYFFNQ